MNNGKKLLLLNMDSGSALPHPCAEENGRVRTELCLPPLTALVLVQED